MARPVQILTVNPHFYLDSKKDAHGQQKVMLSVSFANQRVRMATGIKLHARHWNPEKDRVRSTHDSAEDLNLALVNLASTVQQVYTKATAGGAKLTASSFKELIYDKLTGRAHRAVLEYYDLFLQSREATKPLSYQKAHHSTQTRLKNYAEHTRRRLEFHDLDAQFFQAFTDFLVLSEGNKNTTIVTHIKRIRTFLRWCEQERSITGIPPTYKTKDSMRVQADSTKDLIALTIDELHALERLDLTHNERLHNVRDVFLLGCATGLRFSDLMGIRREHIVGDEIVIRAEKTGDVLNIPILPLAQRVLDRHPNLFRPITNQRFNSYIKEICLRAGMEQKVITVRKAGAKMIETTKPRYECVSSHSMRRTFVSTCKVLGLDDNLVMKITAHKAHRDFAIYLKLASPHVATQLQAAWKDV
jgi:integrase